MAERKFLQETNFQEEYDEDIIPERRGRDQILNGPGRPDYPGSEHRYDKFGNQLRNESDWVIEARKRNPLNG